MWDLGTYKLLRTQNGHNAAVNSVIVGQHLMVSASGDRLIKVWNYADGAAVRDLVGHQRGIACIDFNGDVVVSGSSDQCVIVWNVHTGQALWTIEHAHSDLVRTIAFNR